jgi:hypothetical protein
MASGLGAALSNVDINTETSTPELIEFPERINMEKGIYSFKWKTCLVLRDALFGLLSCWELQMHA